MLDIEKHNIIIDYNDKYSHASNDNDDDNDVNEKKGYDGYKRRDKNVKPHYCVNDDNVNNEDAHKDYENTRRPTSTTQAITSTTTRKTSTVPTKKGEAKLTVWCGLKD